MLGRSCLVLLLLAAVVAIAAAGQPVAQERPDEPRLALVIGNGAYPAFPLANPPNDARDVSTRLRALGFTVIEGIDLDKKAMEDVILEFGERLKAGGVGLFYFAGHAMQLRGQNYLMPIDAMPTSEAAARLQSFDLSLLLDLIGDALNRANIVILDSCRNNPFAGQVRGASSGLAAIDAARGTLIAYSTAPGRVAMDGDGDNSPFTLGFLRALETPGLKAEEVFKRTRSHVVEVSKGEQTPWESSSLTSDVIFHREAANPVAGLTIDPIDRGFQALEPARVRAAPRLDSPQVGSLATGQEVQVLGKVRGQEWYQIEVDGRPGGFVAAALLQDVRRARQYEERRLRLEAYVVPADRRLATAQELRQRTYNELMEFILPRLRHIFGDRAGEHYDYRATPRPKAVAACVNWKAHAGVAFGDPPRQFNDSIRAWAARRDAASPDVARQRTLDACRAFAASNCDCTLVDESDRNVVELPKAYVDRAVLATIARRDGARTPGAGAEARQRLDERTYREIMAHVLPRSRFSDGPDKGKFLDYLGRRNNKALAACIDWAQHARRYHGTGANPPAQEPSVPNWAVSTQQESLDRARSIALDRCIRERKSPSCECTIVDLNDDSALEVPDGFYRQVTGKAAP
ncbi:MAG: caspase family protein [Rhodospirillales bacterium]|nr:caspase family protein [Rhodospirillales bacterium]